MLGGLDHHRPPGPQRAGRLRDLRRRHDGPHRLYSSRENLMTSSIKTLILGGGLAGVSTAYHAPKGSTLLVEREKNVGGTARSFKVGGFTFDFTGHLLHLHSDYTKKLIPRLLNNDVFTCQRDTWI